jgi:hypothetical protein
MKKAIVTIVLAAFAMSGVLLCPLPVRAAALNVVDFGARGDAVQTLANTVSNSTRVTLAHTHRLSGADVGKLIELFGVGPATSATNNQDLIATIVSVDDATSVTISKPASATATRINCTYGTQDAMAFQNCVNACQGSNDVITIPAGAYLMVPPQILSINFEMTSSSTLCPAVSISRGGIKFLGDTPKDTVLLGNGAWILSNGFVQRGIIIGCVGPVTNNAPLVFQNLCFNGGVQVGNLGYGSGPADPVSGGGWDITHDAVVDMSEPPYHTNKLFINCSFLHWRGEMVKSVVSWPTGFIAMINCAFYDGDGSGYNFNITPHVINGCLFSNLDMAMEYAVGPMATNSVFENNIVTNTRIGIALCGAWTNYPSPGYSIISNSISAAKYDICLGPARNVQIIGNTFFGGMGGVATDSAAYQGTDINFNILAQNNQFVNTVYPVAVCGAGRDLMEDMTVESNTAYGCANFASGYGWSSNVVFTGNASLQPAVNHFGLLDSSQLEGQDFIDNPDNNFLWSQVNISHGRLTNIVSYVYGLRQQLNSDTSQGVCLLDTSNPQAIPPNAELMITNASAYPVTLYSSSSTPVGNPVTLPAGSCFAYAWTNGMWDLASGLSPGGLPVIAH